MQKVLHIIWNAKFGGIEKLTFELTNAQNTSGSLQAAVCIAKSEGEFLQQFQSAHFKTHFLLLKGAKSLDFSAYRTAMTVFKQYDVLHFHYFHPLLACIGMLSGKKIVYTEHGNFGFGRKKKKTDDLLNFLKKRFLKSSRVPIVYNSKFTRDYAENKFNLKTKDNSFLVYNGINLRTESERSLTEESVQSFERIKEQIKDKFVVGTSSRFVGFKRIEKLIQAFHKLEYRHESVLLLVGDGVLMNELTSLVEHLNISQQVIFTGYVQHIAAYQALMDVCVFPSAREPFGLVAVETLALGKPTIVFNDGGGLVEIVSKHNALDVVANEDGLIQRISHYKTHPIDSDEKTSRMLYAKNFSIEKMVQNLHSIYTLA